MSLKARCVLALVCLAFRPLDAKQIVSPDDLVPTGKPATTAVPRHHSLDPVPSRLLLGRMLPVALSLAEAQSY